MDHSQEKRRLWKKIGINSNNIHHNSLPPSQRVSPKSDTSKDHDFSFSDLNISKIDEVPDLEPITHQYVLPCKQNKKQTHTLTAEDESSNKRLMNFVKFLIKFLKQQFQATSEQIKSELKKYQSELQILTANHLQFNISVERIELLIQNLKAENQDLKNKLVESEQQIRGAQHIAQAANQQHQLIDQYLDKNLKLTKTMSTSSHCELFNEISRLKEKLNSVKKQIDNKELLKRPNECLQKLKVLQSRSKLSLNGSRPTSKGIQSAYFAKKPNNLKFSTELNKEKLDSVGQRIKTLKSQLKDQIAQLNILS